MNKLSLYILFCIAFTTSCFGADKYVDGTIGNNTNSGYSINSPWKTINYAMSTATAGDTILVKGGVYRESVRLYGNGGTTSNPITIKSYDSNEVIIDASPIPSGTWETSSGSIYRMQPGFVVSNVIVAEKPLLPAVIQWKATSPWIDNSSYNQSNMKEGYFFYEYNTGWLYVWMPGGANPASSDIHLVQYAGAGNDGMYLWNSSYWIIENLTLQYAAWYGVNWQGDNDSGHNTYRNLKIKFCGNTGIDGGPNATIENNHVYYNVMQNWPRGRWNGGAGGWGGGVTAKHDSIFSGNTVHNNGGEGVISYLSNNMIYRGNTIYDNWSVNLYIDNEQNVLVENNLIYSTDPNYSVTTNAGCEGLNCLKRVRGMGIMTADEYYDGAARLQDVTIRNNIVINCKRGYWHSSDVLNSGMKNVDILNNTFVTPSTPVDFDTNDGSGDNYFALGIIDKYDTASDSEIANNIIVARNAKNYALWSETNGSMFDKYNLHHNLIFNTASSTPIHWGPDYQTTHDKTLAQWQALPGGTAHGLGDISADPAFTGGSNMYSSTYYLPAPKSPALEAGATLKGFSKDFNGRTRPTAWAIGALEIGTPAPKIITIQ